MSAKKTPSKTPLRTPAHGKGKLRVGGTNKGGPGRPPDAFKELCRQLASGDLTVKAVKAILKDEAHPQFMAALKWATENGYGKPNQTIEHSGSIDMAPSEREQAVLGILTTARKRQKELVS